MSVSDYKETPAERVLRERVNELEALLQRMQARLESLESATGLFASDKDLDSRFGNPDVKFGPRNWRGPDCVGRKFSECPPDFLDMLAESLAYSAANPKPGKEKYAKYNAIDAARARAWARRIRSGGPQPIDGSADNDAGQSAPSFDAPSFEAPAFDDGPPPVDDLEIPF